MRRKIRSRLLTIVGGFFALVLLLGGAILIHKTNEANAKASEMTGTTPFVLGSDGWADAGNGYRTSKFKFVRNGRTIFHAYCASGNQNTPGLGGTYNVEMHRVDADTDASDKYMKFFKIIYYGTQKGYGVAKIHWALTAVNFNWTPASAPYTVNYEPYTFINSPWPEGLEYGIVYYLNNDGNYNQSIAAAGWQELTTKKIGVDKVWVDENGEAESAEVVGQHETIYVDVYRIDSEGVETKVLENEAVSAPDWTKEWEVEDGYDYKIVETSHTEGYVESDNCGRVKGHCTITNSKVVPETVRLTLEKSWDDEGFEDNRPQQVNFAVKRKIHSTGEYDNWGVTYFLSPKYSVDDNTWRGYVNNLEKGPVPGEDDYYEYEVTERIIYTDGSETEIYLYKQDDSNSYVRTDQNGNIIAHFTNYIETIDVPITKHWDDEGYEDRRPSMIWFMAYAGQAAYDANEWSDYTVIWDPAFWDGEAVSPTWETVMTLPKYDKDGNEIDWKFKEIDSYGKYYVSFDVKNDKTGYEVNNTRLVNVEVIKCWDNDDEESRPDEMVFDLIGSTSKGTVFTDTITMTKEDEIPEGEADEGCWKKSVTGLDFKKDGEEIEYSTKEQPLDDRYKVTPDECEFNKENNFTCSFVNGRVVSVRVDKIWQNDDPKDRPGYIEVTLYQDGKAYGDSVILNNDNNWSFTWTNLEYGHEYTVTENIQIPKYKPGAYTYEEDENGNIYVKIFNAPETRDMGIGKYTVVISGVMLGGFMVCRRLMARR